MRRHSVHDRGGRFDHPCSVVSSCRLLRGSSVCLSDRDGIRRLRHGWRSAFGDGQIYGVSGSAVRRRSYSGRLPRVCPVPRGGLHQCGVLSGRRGPDEKHSVSGKNDRPGCRAVCGDVWGLKPPGPLGGRNRGRRGSVLPGTDCLDAAGVGPWCLWWFCWSNGSRR